MARKVYPPPLVAHPNLVALRAAFYAAKEALDSAEIAWEVEATALVNAKLGTTYDRTDLHFGSWECPTSPSVECVYDADEGGMH